MTARTRLQDITARGLAEEIMEQADTLAGCSQDSECLTRCFLTPEHANALKRLRAWMEEAGLSVRLDEAGNLIGRYEAEHPGAPTLMIGSHQDSVRDAGKYDGPLGILLGIATVKALTCASRRFPFAIEVVAFGDEEGSRFPVSMMGSRALAGTFDPALLDQRDGDGVGLADAFRQFGLDPAAVKNAAIDPQKTIAYVEAHIEQGPVLESLDLPVGVVSAIAGVCRLEAVLGGTAGHAGTTPMDQRRDALTAAAECALMVEKYCRQTGNGVVGTVGELEIKPGSANVIPGEVRLVLDLRAPDNETRDAAKGAICKRIRQIAEDRGLVADICPTYAIDACACTPWVAEQLAQAVSHEKVAPHHLVSGAAHDSQSMSAAVPIGMLFVRCKQGISHSPRESIKADDVEVAIRVLQRFLADFKPEPDK